MKRVRLVAGTDHRGQIAPELGPLTRELIARLGGHHVVEFSLACREGASQRAEFWSDLPSVVSSRHEADAFHLAVTEPHRVLPALVERLEQRRWRLASLVTRHASLDDVFVMLTGRAFQQAEEVTP